MMDKVKKPSNSKYYTPLSEPFGIYYMGSSIIHVNFFSQNILCWWVTLFMSISAHDTYISNKEKYLGLLGFRTSSIVQILKQKTHHNQFSD
jgi:hypothetical protein